MVDVVLHPGYNPSNLYSDLAVLKLDKAVKYTDYVRPACLWQESADLGSILRRDGVVVGWGSDSEGRYTDRLTQAKLSVSPLDVCLNKNPNLATFISDKSFCTRYSKGERNDLLL